MALIQLLMTLSSVINLIYADSVDGNPNNSSMINGPLPSNYTIDFKCDNLKQVPYFLICDGVDDCGDNSDESDNTCLDIKCTDADTFFCRSINKKMACISRNLYCMGFPYCKDGSDVDARICVDNLCDNNLNITDGYCGNNGKCVSDVRSHTGPFKKCDCVNGKDGKRCQNVSPIGPTVPTTTRVPLTTSNVPVTTTNIPTTESPSTDYPASTAITATLSVIIVLLIIGLLSIVYLKRNYFLSRFNSSRLQLMQLNQDEVD